MEEQQLLLAELEVPLQEWNPLLFSSCFSASLSAFDRRKQCETPRQRWWAWSRSCSTMRGCRGCSLFPCDTHQAGRTLSLPPSSGRLAPQLQVLQARSDHGASCSAVCGAASLLHVLVPSQRENKAPAVSRLCVFRLCEVRFPRAPLRDESRTPMYNNVAMVTVTLSG